MVNTWLGKRPQVELLAGVSVAFFSDLLSNLGLKHPYIGIVCPKGSYVLSIHLKPVQMRKLCVQDGGDSASHHKQYASKKSSFREDRTYESNCRHILILINSIAKNLKSTYEQMASKRFHSSGQPFRATPPGALCSDF